MLEFSLTDMCKAETIGYNWTRPKHRGLGSNGEKVKRRRMPIMNAQAGVLKKWSEDEKTSNKTPRSWWADEDGSRQEERTMMEADSVACKLVANGRRCDPLGSVRLDTCCGTTRAKTSKVSKCTRHICFLCWRGEPMNKGFAQQHFYKRPMSSFRADGNKVQFVQQKSLERAKRM